MIELMLNPRFKCLKILLPTMAFAHGKSLIAAYDITVVDFSIAIFYEETRPKRVELDVTDADWSEGADSISPFSTHVK